MAISFGAGISRSSQADQTTIMPKAIIPGIFPAETDGFFRSPGPANKRMSKAALRAPLSPEEVAQHLGVIYDGQADVSLALTRLTLPFEEYGKALAWRIMQRFSLGKHSRIQQADLLNEANLALLQSISRKKIKLEDAPTTYVGYVQRVFVSSMLDYVRRNYKQVRGSHSYEIAYMMTYGIQHQFFKEHGREPNLEEIKEIAQKQQMKPVYFRHLDAVHREMGTKLIQLDQPMGADGDRTMAEYIADSAPSPEAQAHLSKARVRVVECVADGFAKMTPLQQYAIARHYDLWPGLPSLTQHQIAEELIAATGKQRGLESIGYLESEGFNRLVSSLQPLLYDLDDPPASIGRGMAGAILERLSPTEAGAFLPSHPVMLALAAIYNGMDFKKPLDEVSVVFSNDRSADNPKARLADIHPAIPRGQSGYLVYYAINQKAHKLNPVLNSLYEFLKARPDQFEVVTVPPNTLRPYSSQPNTRIPGMRILVFEPNRTQPKTLVVMEKANELGDMGRKYMAKLLGTDLPEDVEAARAVLIEQLPTLSERDRDIVTMLFDLNGDGTGAQTTTAVSQAEGIDLTQSAVSKVAQRIIAAVKADVAERRSSGQAFSVMA